MVKLQISLAAARVNAKMTQEDVSKAANVSKQTVVNWESGKTKPSMATIHFLADLYKIPEDCFLLPEHCT